ncbi:MAG: hypothetical protein JO205_04525 [Pseudolabrys sp.]|nr:hypothetical protein [Pseudolabrys sp.]
MAVRRYCAAVMEKLHQKLATLPVRQILALAFVAFAVWAWLTQPPVAVPQPTLDRIEYLWA